MTPMRIVFNSDARVTNFTADFLHSARALCSFKDKKAAMAKRYVYNKDSIDDELSVFKVNPEALEIILPRGFPFQNFTECETAEVVDNRLSVPAKIPPIKRELTPTQHKNIEAVWDSREDICGGFLLIKPVSTGKTTVAATLAQLFQQRTLIIVDTQLIMRGWIRDLSEAFGLDQKSIGIVQGKKHTIGKYFTVAMVQTLARQQVTLLSKLKKKFGTVIIDETHVAAARTIYSVVNSFPAKYRIGITATDERRDGLQKMFHLLYGGVFIQEQVPEEETETSVPINLVRRRVTSFSTKTDPRRFVSLYYKELSLDRRRNVDIAREVCYEMVKGHVALVVCHTRNHASIMLEEIQRRLPMKKGVVKLGIGGKGGKQSEDIFEGFATGRYKCLVATLSYIMKGVSINRLDRLFIVTPIGFHENVEQLLGRMKRKHPSKKFVIVFDYVDPTPWGLKVARVSHLRAFHSQKVKKIKMMES